VGVSPVSYFDALNTEKAELIRRAELTEDEELKIDLADRVKQVDVELKKAGPAAVEHCRAQILDLNVHGDPAVRGVEAELARVEAELGYEPSKVERAAKTAGGDAGGKRTRA
jgi:hypothetical protein